MITQPGEEIFRPILNLLELEPAIRGEDPRGRVRPLRFEERPFSYILQVTAGAERPSSAQVRAYVKVFKPKPNDGGVMKMRRRVSHEFQTTRRVYEGMRRHPDLGAVCPLACYPDHLALVTQEAPGQTLLAYLHKKARWSPGTAAMDSMIETMETIGRWIRAFQALAPATGRVSLRDLRAYIDLRLARLVAEPRAHFGLDDRLHMLRHIDALSAQVDTLHLDEVLVHADLSLGNVLVDGGRVVVLDFAMAHAGNAFQDLTRLIVQIELLKGKPQFRSRVIERLQGALLKGFDPALTPRVPLFRLMLLQHRINHFATLCVQHAGFPVSLYNAHLRRRHRTWIARELAPSTPVREAE